MGVMRNGATVVGQTPAIRGIGTGDGLINISKKLLLSTMVLAVQRLNPSTKAVAIDSYTTLLCGPSEEADPGPSDGAGAEPISENNASFVIGIAVGNAALNGSGPVGPGRPVSASPPGGTGMLKLPINSGAPISRSDCSNCVHTAVIALAMIAVHGALGPRARMVGANGGPTTWPPIPVPAVYVMPVSFTACCHASHAELMAIHIWSIKLA